MKSVPGLSPRDAGGVLPLLPVRVTLKLIGKLAGGIRVGMQGIEVGRSVFDVDAMVEGLHPVEHPGLDNQFDRRRAAGDERFLPFVAGLVKNLNAYCPCDEQKALGIFRRVFPFMKMGCEAFASVPEVHADLRAVGHLPLPRASAAHIRDVRGGQGAQHIQFGSVDSHLSASSRA